MKDSQQPLDLYREMINIVNTYMGEHPDAEGSSKLVPIASMMRQLFEVEGAVENSEARRMGLVVFQQFIMEHMEMTDRSASQEKLYMDLQRVYQQYISVHDPVSAEDWLTGK